jgi:hypothetical protein
VATPQFELNASTPRADHPIARDVGHLLSLALMGALFRSWNGFSLLHFLDVFYQNVFVALFTLPVIMTCRAFWEELQDPQAEMDK